ncbi:signal recognition particle [Thermococcus chitonophagus]|uniref:Signal recognition particle 19 kDa protein n=1 Tax=Thermococcus chitonophagus TaxID=54262 RepID=A0A170T1W2_9EURY|nr:signal recognition particle protein Srp19 [Thermococcus chitonophagus]ASJ16115.1 signal recognition particle [Thermococcus chitonophagus]CUX78917.1 signal recognition particle, subunit SRP19, putative [Thermococcus chitonophagus]
MGKFVVWPSELDGRLTRKYGRIVPKGLAIDNPSLDEIIDALEIVGAKIISVERDKLNPRLSGVEEDLRTYGMIIVESPYGKAKTLKLVAQKIRELRKRRR